LNYSIIPQIQERAKGRTIISLLGSLDKRKGVLTLLEIARSSLSENWFFLFSGTFHEGKFSSHELQAIRESILQPPENCFFHLQYIPGDPQFNALVAISDIVFAVYNYPHSSNILTKAAVFEKPVIVQDYSCMSERVRQFHLGGIVEPDNIEQCIYVLRNLCQQTRSGSFQQQTRFQDYKQCHSLNRLSQQFQIILEQI
jgi:hypothetical protein